MTSSGSVICCCCLPKASPGETVDGLGGEDQTKKADSLTRDKEGLDVGTQAQPPPPAPNPPEAPGSVNK